jgi:subtilisin family serine protease
VQRARLPYLITFALVVAACADDTALTSPDENTPETLAPAATVLTLADLNPTGRYLLLGKGGSLPSNLAASIAAAGGTVQSEMPEIGVAVVEGAAADFASKAAKIGGVESVTPDVLLQWHDPQPVGRAPVDVEAEIGGSVGEEVASFADNAFFYSFQWAPAAIQAPEAWNAGYTGQGVRVAILDGAVYNAHLDLAPNMDVTASASFVPGFAYNQDVGTFWHGTHVAGIVAASGLIGTAGIAPNATIIGVKVLHNGSGAFEWILNGILYAATSQAQGGAGAHVINMSLGATIDYRNNWTDKAFRDAFRELEKAYDRAVQYAYQQGVTVIASAGNGGTNFDAAKHLYKIPAESQHVISVSATGPHGWALGATNFERPTFYTDHGKSLVDVAAPGGTPGLFVEDGVDQVCIVNGTFTTIVQFCEVFDMVFSTVRGGAASTASYNWAYGTSMAAPAAAGVAALIIEANGGSMNPHAVAAALQASAIDLGKPGQDIFYGHGWINALRAVNR